MFSLYLFICALFFLLKISWIHRNLVHHLISYYYSVCLLSWYLFLLNFEMIMFMFVFEFMLLILILMFICFMFCIEPIHGHYSLHWHLLSIEILLTLGLILILMCFSRESLGIWGENSQKVPKQSKSRRDRFAQIKFWKVRRRKYVHYS